MASYKRAKKNGHKKVAKTNPIHEKLISLFKRPDGATLHDTWNAGYHFPAMAAVKIAKRRGLKVKIIKKKGELTRYVAR